MLVSMALGATEGEETSVRWLQILEAITTLVFFAAVAAVSHFYVPAPYGGRSFWAYFIPMALAGSVWFTIYPVVLRYFQCHWAEKSDE